MGKRLLTGMANINVDIDETEMLDSDLAKCMD